MSSDLALKVLKWSVTTQIEFEWHYDTAEWGGSPPVLVIQQKVGFSPFRDARLVHHPQSSSYKFTISQQGGLKFQNSRSSTCVANPEAERVITVNALAFRQGVYRISDTIIWAKNIQLSAANTVPLTNPVDGSDVFSRKLTPHLISMFSPYESATLLSFRRSGDSELDVQLDKGGSGGFVVASGVEAGNGSSFAIDDTVLTFTSLDHSKSDADSLSVELNDNPGCGEPAFFPIALGEDPSAGVRYLYECDRQQQVDPTTGAITGYANFTVFDGAWEQQTFESNQFTYGFVKLTQDSCFSANASWYVNVSNSPENVVAHAARGTSATILAIIVVAVAASLAGILWMVIRSTKATRASAFEAGETSEDFSGGDEAEQELRGTLNALDQLRGPRKPGGPGSGVRVLPRGSIRPPPDFSS